METAFEKQSYMDHALIWAGSIGGEENAECIVPDSMPDLGAIVDADAILSLRSKELSGGRLSVLADISVKILYQPQDEETLRSLSVAMSSSMTVPVATEDACIPVVALRIRSAEGRIVNSRKASVRVEIVGMAYCYQKCTLDFIQAIAACGCTVETLNDRMSACFVSDVREKTFVLTDDLALPASMDDVDSILTQRVSLQTDDMEFAGDKLVFRGRALSFLLLRKDERVYPCTYESEFSQIMELDGGSESAPEIVLALTGAYFDLPDHSGGKLGMELHLLAQVVSLRKAEISYVTDIYSNQRPLDSVFSERNLCCSQRIFHVRHNVKCSADAPQEVEEILFVKGCIGSMNIGADGLDLSVNLRAVYRGTDGSFGSISRRAQETIPLDTSDGETLRIVGATIVNASANTGNSGIELRAAVEIRVQAQCMTTLRHLTDLIVLDGNLPDAPSLTLLHCSGEDALWELAKTHHSTREAILEANSGRTEGLLLIPKCR